MKTISVSEEMYNSLIELSESINNQDHRATAMPYFYQVRTMEKVPAVEGNGTKAWMYDGSVLDTKIEIKDAIDEYKDWNGHTSQFDLLKDYEIDSIMENAGYQEIWYEEKEVFSNAFLTEKGCKQHIQQNKHRYDHPVDYLTHAFRNPEMEIISKFLCELSGGKIHK